MSVGYSVATKNNAFENNASIHYGRQLNLLW